MDTIGVSFPIQTYEEGNPQYQLNYNTFWIESSDQKVGKPPMPSRVSIRVAFITNNGHIIDTFRLLT